MTVSLFKSTAKGKVLRLVKSNMGNLSLTMIRAISPCSIKMILLNLKFLVEPILKYGKF